MLADVAAQRGAAVALQAAWRGRVVRTELARAAAAAAVIQVRQLGECSRCGAACAAGMSAAGTQQLEASTHCSALPLPPAAPLARCAHVWPPRARRDRHPVGVARPRGAPRVWCDAALPALLPTRAQRARGCEVCGGREGGRAGERARPVGAKLDGVAATRCGGAARQGPKARQSRVPLHATPARHAQPAGRRPVASALRSSCRPTGAPPPRAATSGARAPRSSAARRSSAAQRSAVGSRGGTRPRPASRPRGGATRFARQCGRARPLPPSYRRATGAAASGSRSCGCARRPSCCRRGGGVRWPGAGACFVGDGRRPRAHALETAGTTILSFWP